MPSLVILAFIIAEIFAFKQTKNIKTTLLQILRTNIFIFWGLPCLFLSVTYMFLKTVYPFLIVTAYNNVYDYCR